MTRDATSIEEVAWTLWCTALCRCERCGKMLPLDQFETLADSPDDWARAAAPYVQAQGWTAPSEFELLCNDCSRGT